MTVSTLRILSVIQHTIELLRPWDVRRHLPECGMNLFTITFDSSSDGKEIPKGTPPVSLPGTPPRPRFAYRNLGSDSVAQKTPPEKLIEGIERLAIVRHTQVKVGRIRLFYSGSCGSSALFHAKAKASNGTSIPVTTGPDVHFSSPTDHIGCLRVDGAQTDFTLISNQSQRHLLVVQFAAPRAPDDGARRTFLRFIAQSQWPSQLASVPADWFLDEIRFPIRSVKNTVLADEAGNAVIWAKKTGQNEVEVSVKARVDPLWLFGIGIAVFMGRPPTH
jgi:hypothetical protein